MKKAALIMLLLSLAIAHPPGAFAAHHSLTKTCKLLLDNCLERKKLSTDECKQRYKDAMSSSDAFQGVWNGRTLCAKDD